MRYRDDNEEMDSNFLKWWAIHNEAEAVNFDHDVDYDLAKAWDGSKKFVIKFQRMIEQILCVFESIILFGH